MTETVKDILLALALIGVGVFGFFIMSRLDRFLEENRKSIEREDETKGPRCIVLSEELSNEEIAEEVERFKKKHKHISIMLYDRSDTDLSEKIEHPNE